MTKGDDVCVCTMGPEAVCHWWSLLVHVSVCITLVENVANPHSNKTVESTFNPFLL